MKHVMVICLLASLVLRSSCLQVSMAGSALCNSKCAVRCSNARFSGRCLKLCGICCEKCSCVPSGTSFGNKDECPCYRDMKNSKGKCKCP